MKNNIKNKKSFNKTVYITFAITLLLILAATPLTALAEGNVSYEGQADGFVFEPGSDSSATDLFPNFKDVVPGDSFTDSVEVKNNSSEGKTVKMYMRATGAEEGSADFLSQMGLTVSSENKELFDATAEKTEGLTDWVLLGTLKPGGTVKLDIELTVPITMDNNYQNATGYLGWQFKVEEIDEDKPTDKPDDKTTDKTSKKSGAKTGDESDILLWIVLLTISVIGIKAIKKKA